MTEGSRTRPELTVEEYEHQLRELILTACDADIDIEGGFIVGDRTDETYWNIEITKRERSADGDEIEG